MTRWVALLRGINVGATNRIAMAKLRSALETLGLQDVVTYVQSGNVVFGSSAARGTVTADLERRIAEVFGASVAVLLRTEAELAGIAARNPWLEKEDDRKKLHVVFLDTAPRAAAVAKLDPERSPPDEFVVDGSEIFVRYPNGSGRSKLTLDYFEPRLGVRATARNWNTVLKLLELMQE